MSRRLVIACCSLLAVVLAPFMASCAALPDGPGSSGQNPTDTAGASSDTAEDSAARRSSVIAPEVPGWQINDRNIGLAPFGLTCDDLPVYRGPATPRFGAKIVGKLVTKPLDLSRGGVTVRRSCIRPTSPGPLNNYLVSTTTCGATCYPPERGRTVITDSEISGFAMSPRQIAGSCGFMGVATIRRTLFHGMGTGICIMDTGTEDSVLVEQNYVTDLRACCGSHNEAATVRDFDNEDSDRTVVFRNNRLGIDLDGFTSGGLFIQPTWTSIYHLEVVGNLIEGIGYNLVVTGSQPGEGAEYDDLVAVDNRFLSQGYGPTSVDGGPGWDVWRDNHHYVPGRPGARGRPVPKP